MTPEEAKARVAAQDAELAQLEAEVARRAQENPGPVFLAIMRALVEWVCAREGEHFRVLRKTQFYRGVLGLLGSVK